jgi:hypothetical protein
MVDLDRVGLGLAAFLRVGLQLRLELRQAVLGHELADVAVFPVVELPKRRVERIGDDGFDGAACVEHDGEAAVVISLLAVVIPRSR